MTSESTTTWPQIEQWILAGERPLSGAQGDLFQHHRIADRIVRNIVFDRQDVALLGRFGSGKSSILNMVSSELGRWPGAYVVADLDLWAVPNPDDVPRLALSRILGALDDIVDTVQFRGLPVAYQRLASAEPTGRLSAALGFTSAEDSIELLRGLSELLDTVDARVVLLVQDLERAGGSFDSRHLQRLLWAFRNATSLQFILSVDPDHAPLDFPKLCDSVELIPALEIDHVRRILSTALGHWRTRYADIDPYPERPDIFHLAQSLADGMASYIHRTGGDSPLDALCELLDTPRSLKHVLRRVNYAWSNLHGEAELDHILVLSALRHAAEPAYRFLLAEIDPARHKPDDWLPKTKRVKDEWAKTLSALSTAPAVQRLVDLLGIEQLTGDPHRATDPSPQGAGTSEPVDYFRRIVAEELGPEELRDQSVLRAIGSWRDGRVGDLVERLLDSTEERDEYARAWEHYSDRHTADDLQELTRTLVERLKKRDGATAAADHPALIALWRRANRRLAGGMHQQWLRDLVVDAVPVSLHLANGLFYYWTGRHGIVDETERADINRALGEAVRAHLRTPDALARALDPSNPYLVVRLVTQTGATPTAQAFEAWNDFLPDLLVAGAKQYPQLLVPELANLAGDSQSGLVAAAGGYPPVFANPYAIDRSRMAALFGDRLSEALILLRDYAGDNAYAVRAREAAGAWLKELN